MSIGTSEMVLEEGSVDSVELVSGDIAARSPLQLFWRRLRQDRVATVSAGFIIFMILVAIAAPLVVSILGLPGPLVQNNSLTDAFGSPTGPSGAHPFGVDELGRDILSRIIYGARVSLEVGILGTAIAAAVGTTIGLVAGFYRGWVDSLLMRAVDVFLAFPVLILGLGIGAACGVFGCLGGIISPGVPTVLFIIALSNFTYIARIVRGQVLSLREKEYVEAARSLGASNLRIVFRELLPNLLAPLIVYSSLLVPQNILLEAALSFLGIGVRAPEPTWGNMISASQSYLTPPPSWWYMVFPGVALLLTVLAFNLLGDGLLDALNPRGTR
ncbi:MAG: ABC transporter permease [Solirubrobacteraceae bacterium]